MPSVLPTIPFISRSLSGAAAIAFQDTSAAGTAFIECSLGALGAGSGTTVTSLGLNAGFAPSSATELKAKVSGTAFENGALAIAAGGFVSADAFVRFSLLEFSATGHFIQNRTGAPVFLYRDTEYFLGVNAHQNEVHGVNIDSLFPVSPGNFYRLFVDSVQDVFAEGAPPTEAVSNFSYSFGQVTFNFF